MVNMKCFVVVLSALVLVSAEDDDKSLTDSKTTNKRGISGLTGVPGVLYSSGSPHVHTVPVPQPFPVPVPHPVPVQVPRPFPVTVHKPVGLPVPVGVPVPVNVPVPKPYPVPVPVHIPQGPSPLSSFGASPFASHPVDFSGGFPQSAFGLSAASPYSGKFGYGLGLYNSPGTPSLPPANPSLAASLSSLMASSLAAHPGALQGAGLQSFFPDSFGSHPSKY